MEGKSINGSGSSNRFSPHKLQLPSPVVVVVCIWVIVVWIVVIREVIVVNWIPVVIISGIPVMAKARRQPVIVDVMCR
jgi:hypothetical protein